MNRAAPHNLSLLVALAVVAAALVVGCRVPGRCGQGCPADGCPTGACPCGAACGETRCERFCRWLGFDRCADIPSGAIPQPLGTFACQWQHAQMDRAELTDFVLFEHEFQNGGAELGPDGRRHIERLVPRLESSAQPVVIARSGDDNLDEARRTHVAAVLAAYGLDEPELRVLSDDPRAEGLYGPEAARIGQQRLNGTSTLGGGGGLGGGGFGGATLGGAGLGGFGGGMGVY